MRLCCGNPFKPTIWEYKPAGLNAYLEINNYNNIFNSNTPNSLSIYQKYELESIIMSYKYILPRYKKKWYLDFKELLDYCEFTVND